MTTKRPNILLFFTDQQRWDTLGVNGGAPGLTPNLDRLAAANTHFPHAYTCQPVCGPARACLQTGQYAPRNGSISTTWTPTTTRPAISSTRKPTPPAPAR